MTPPLSFASSCVGRREEEFNLIFNGNRNSGRALLESWNIAENVIVTSLGRNCSRKCLVSAKLTETVAESDSKNRNQNCFQCGTLCTSAETDPKNRKCDRKHAVSAILTETVAESVCEPEL